MITFRAFATLRDWKTVQLHLPLVLSANTKGIIAERAGQFVGAVMFDNWTFNAVTAHMVALTPMVWRRMPYEVCDYVFNQCGKGVMIGMTPSNNLPALKINQHFGFTELFRIKDGVEVGVDCVFQEMRKETCKWISHGPATSPLQRTA